MMDIEKISALARLKLNKEEKEILGKDLDSILRYVGKLKEADVDGAPELTHALTVVNDVREDDVPKKSYADSAGLSDAAPEQEKGFVKVKGVFHGQN